MKISNVFNIWDYHTTGCPLRMLVKGMPDFKGNNMMEKMHYMEEHFDWIRTCVLCEPRGHQDQMGAVIIEPCDPTCDIGVFYIETENYVSMCGAGTIAVARAVVERGMVEMKEPVTEVRMDTPAGVVTAYVDVKDGEVTGVAFRSVESFMLPHDDLSVDMGEYGEVKFTLMYGGHYFALIDAKQFPDLEVTVPNAKKWAALGTELRKKATEKYVHLLKHPTNPELDAHFQRPELGVECSMFYATPYEENGKMVYPEILIFAKDEVDRSPCGTGTTARLAVHYTRGELKLNEEFVHEGVTGSRFIGKVIAERKADNGVTMCQTEVKGQAYPIGFNTLLVDRDDPLKEGFLLH